MQTGTLAPIARHIQVPRREAISLSGARNRPRLSESGMAEPERDFADITRGPQHHHCRAVPQAVRRDLSLLQRRVTFGCSLNVLVKNVFEARACQRLAVSIDKQLLRPFPLIRTLAEGCHSIALIGRLCVVSRGASSTVRA